MINCKNCNNSFEGNFCPNCGQKVITKRYNLKDSFSWLLNAIFNLDHGFIFTTRELIIRPGTVIRDVLNGVTVKYTHPFRLLFIWATISSLVTIILGTYDETTQALQSVDQTAYEHSEAQLAFQAKVQEVMKKYLSFIIMANVPIIALFSWLFYRKKGYNYTEHLILNAFGFSVSAAIGLIVVFIQYYTHAAEVMSVVSILLNVIILAYVYMSTFKEKYIFSFLKFFFALVFSYLTLMIISALAVIAVAMLSEAFGWELFPFKSNKT